MRKFARWYLSEVPEGEELRYRINRLEQAESIKELIRAALLR